MMTQTMSAQQLAKLSTLVARWTGLHFPKDRWTELERGVARASQELGHSSTDAFMSRLMAQSLDDEQIQKLAWHLTIGETYFLRGKSAFEVLEKKIIPRLISERRSSRQIRIWSAGCSGGEEPYSLAVMMARHIADLADWRVTILATDINTQSLEKARRGIYGSWSFRDTPDWLRQHYFTEVGRDQWEIRPQIKEMVTFSYLNLALDPFPSLLNNTYAMDLIFCRNVVMYFGRDVMAGVVSNFHESLRDGGHLFTAPSEASHELFPQFARAAEFGEVFFCKDDDAVAAEVEAKKVLRAGAATLARKTSGRAPAKPASARPKAPAAPGKASTPAKTPAKTPAARRPAAAKPTPAAATPAGAPDQAAQLISEARAGANRGQLDEALAKCEQAIAIDKLNAGYRYLYATILQELDRPDEAIKALNSALYLDRDFVLAHFLLGNIARGNSRAAEAETHFRRALSLLDAMPEDTELPEADGLTAGRLAKIITSILQTEVV